MEGRGRKGKMEGGEEKVGRKSKEREEKKSKEGRGEGKTKRKSVPSFCLYNFYFFFLSFLPKLGLPILS